MDKDFLLSNETAINLYSKVKDLPIIDYHCHLIPKEIAENKRFKNITEIWLNGDHYKWRIMRAMGVNEKYITGEASDYEKFEKWAETIQYAIGNPLFHWTHLELKRYFKYDGLLTKETAKEVWEHCNRIIQSEDFCVWKILDEFNVAVICTTDDPIDNLEYHQKIKSDLKNTKVLPTYRPSAVMNIDSDSWIDYIKNLSAIVGNGINSYGDIVEALYKRITFFNENGCKLSDHSLDPPVYEEATHEELDRIVLSALSNEKLTDSDIRKFKTAILIDQCKKYYEYGWTVQLHVGCIRNTNSSMFAKLGADKGYDCIDDASYARQIVKILDKLASQNVLSKTILYSLNPTLDDVIGTICGCFQDGESIGKIQFGSAWWFNDHFTGMEKQMTALANQGMLACFVGMLTDSRSFLSYTRHEYFRRILCNLIGKWVENGEYPNDEKTLEKIVSDIAFYNANEYFKF